MQCRSDIQVGTWMQLLQCIGASPVKNPSFMWHNRSQICAPVTRLISRKLVYHWSTPGYLFYKVQLPRMFLLDSEIILRMMNIILYLYQGLQIKFPFKINVCVILCLDMNIGKMTSEMVLMCVYSSVVYRVIGKYCLISNNSKSSWWQSNIIASVMCCKWVPAKVRAKRPDSINEEYPDAEPHTRK